MNALPQPHPLPSPERQRPDEDAPPLGKRSFLKLPVAIDVGALLSDYRALPKEAWKVSHWEAHCSSDMVLLRGGQKGTSQDFTTRDVRSAPFLDKLPYLRHLVSDDGPFGATTYAFIFRMKPLGVARPHLDDDPAWADPFRIHLPITTNPGALLLVEGRAQHLAVGEAWTFDNQQMHAVTNGPTARAHLILDVFSNKKLQALLRGATHSPGIPEPSAWARSQVTAQPVLSPFVSEPLSPEEKRALGLDPEGFAARVTEVRWPGRLSGAGVQRGDILCEVEGVTACEMARTATEYLLLRHQPGDRVTLALLRKGRRVWTSLRLHRNFLPPSARRALWRAKDAVRAWEERHAR